MDNEITNYNWGGYDFSRRNIQVLDTSLRDGLQDADLRHPTLEEKEKFVDMLPKIGVNAVDIAIPIAGGPHLKDAIKLARRLPSDIQITCLARTTEADIRAALELSQGAGRSIESIVFIGASALRRSVEGWDLKDMIKWMEDSVTFATKEGIKVNVATEHTTESEPSVIKQIYRAGLEAGGKMVCIADTTGAADAKSVKNIVRYFKKVVLKGFESIEIDWHGHDDMGLSVGNSLAALEAGVDRVHGTALGIGERAGNTPIEQILIDLKVAGDPKRQDLTHLLQFAQNSSRIFGVPLRSNYPGVGDATPKTASGIHAAAERRLRMQGRKGSVYSRVKQDWFGRAPSVVIGPLSGTANVLEVAERLGIPATQKLIDVTLETAKVSNRLLTDEDVINIDNSIRSNGHTHARN